jgi:hypothetical protein
MFAEGIKPLGVVPFYPLNESARLGQVYLADASTGEQDGDPVAFIPTNVLLTEAVVPAIEAARSARLAAKNRFPCSSDKLTDQIRLTNQARSYYQQTACTSSAPAAQATAAATTVVVPAPAATTVVVPAPAATTVVVPAPATTAAAAPAGKAAVDKQEPASLAPLELAGLPSYSLGSIDNVTLAGSAPTGFANFLATIGFRRSTSLNVEAEGVEVATLPADEFAAAIRKACTSSGNPFSDPQLAKAAMTFADAELYSHAKTRHKAQQRPSDQSVAYRPRLIMLRKVYYLRGIRYIFSDTRAYSALIEAAASGKIPTASQPPATPNISMNVVTAPQSGVQASNPDAMTTAMAALQSQIDSLRAAISSNANIQIAGTYAHATARGIEFVELFQRPLAFGYTPIARAFDIDRGYEAFCADTRGDMLPPLEKKE